MGKTPRILAPAQPQIEVVACHPKQEVVAAGYADGLVLLVRIEDGAEVLARKGAGAPIAARPIIAPAIPVSLRRLAISAALERSPLPITGIGTATATSPMTFQSALPE